MAPNRTLLVLLALWILPPPAAAGRGPAVLPIEAVGNRILVKGVTVNGTPDQVLVFDSGAGSSGIFASEAGRLGLVPDREIEALGAGGATRVGVTSGNRIAFGHVLLDGVDLAHFAVPATVSGAGVRAVGIIGYDLLKDHVVSLDFDRSVMMVHEPGTFRRPEGRDGLRLVFHGRTPGLLATVKVSPGDSVEGEFGLDLGAPNALQLDSAVVARYRLLERREGLVKRRMRGVGPADFTAYETRLPELRLGAAVLRDVPTLLLESDPEVYRRDERIGVLGMAVLKRFHLAFDYPGRRLYLEPNLRYDSPFEAPMATAAPPGAPSAPPDSAFAAARAGDLERLQACLRADASLVNRPSPQGFSLLHVAASKGHAAVVRWLLEQGADPNAREPRNGATPLHLAVYFGHREAVETLVAGGADVRAVDGSGRTPITVAEETGKGEYAPLLTRK